MAEYRSIHSGSNIDTAVSSVLNHTCGIQGVKVLGTELSKDANNKVDVSWSSLVTEGDWTPSIVAKGEGGNDVSSTTNYDYRWGCYIKLGGLCYIAFRLKGRITNLDTSVASYLKIAGLPFVSRVVGSLADSQEFAINIAELSVENRALDFGFRCDVSGSVDSIESLIVNQHGMTTCKVDSGSSYITFEKSNGMSAVAMSITNNSYVWISASGWYPIATS